jgi:Co/Zn/Cd efflux system component
VLADALTSLLAIFALMAGKYFGLIWMDPLMGIVGAILVGRWSLGLLHTSSSVLLDRQGPLSIRSEIQESIESRDDNRVADLHLWSIGPNIYALELIIVSHDPQQPDYYKEMLSHMVELVHVNIEIHRCVYEDEIQ